MDMESNLSGPRTTSKKYDRKRVKYINVMPVSKQDRKRKEDTSATESSLKGFYSTIDHRSKINVTSELDVTKSGKFYENNNYSKIQRNT
jgi:phage FluMu gp28-like protein